MDGDLSANAASWQWVAGSGTDSQPFFRVFNPVLQGQKFDPDGAYVRRWVPELAQLPDRYLHAPWDAPAAVLAAGGGGAGARLPQSRGRVDGRAGPGAGGLQDHAGGGVIPAGPPSFAW